MTHESPDSLYSPPQVRDRFLPALSLTVIYRLIKSGEIAPVYRRGRKWLIPGSSVQEYIDREIKGIEPCDAQGTAAESSKPLRTEMETDVIPSNIVSISDFSKRS